MSGIPDRIGRAAGVASAAGGAGGAVRATTDAPEPLTDWPLMVFQPNATSVEAGFFTWEVATGEVICDPGTYRMHGLPEATSASMDAFLSRVPESDLPDVVEAMKRMVASCGTYQIEYRVAREDGSLRCIEARGRVLPGPDGSPVRMTG